MTDVVLVDDDDAAGCGQVRFPEFVFGVQTRDVVYHAPQRRDLMRKEAEVGDTEFLATLFPEAQHYDTDGVRDLALLHH